MNVETEALAAWLVRKAKTRPIIGLVIAKGPSFEGVIETLDAAEVDRPWDDVATDAVRFARAHAVAFKVLEPYTFWVLRDGGDRPAESLPVTFPEAIPTEKDLRNDLLIATRAQIVASTQRETAVFDIISARRDNEIDRVEKYAAMLAESEARARADVASMYKEVVTSSITASEALQSADAREQAKRAAARLDATRAWLMKQGELVVPSVLAGMLKKNLPNGGGDPTTTAEYKLLTELWTTSTDEQKGKLEPYLNMAQRALLLQIMKGEIPALILPQTSARIFLQIDEKTAGRIWEILGPPPEGQALSRLQEIFGLLWQGARAQASFLPPELTDGDGSEKK